MTCKDCIHYNVCWQSLRGDLCECFKDKSHIIELPCNIGDKVWYITGIHNTLIKEAEILQITFAKNGILEVLVSGENCLFKNYFDIFYLSKEDAEEALERRKKNDL